MLTAFKNIFRIPELRTKMLVTAVCSRRVAMISLMVALMTGSSSDVGSS